MSGARTGDAGTGAAMAERRHGEAPITGRMVATSALWRLVEVVGSEGTALLVFVVLARLLVPEHFGVVALAGVFVMAAQAVLHQGLAEAVIQAAAITDRRLATAFWANLGLGLGLMLLLQLLSPPLAWLFGEPMLAPVLAALALVLPLGAAAAILQARFLRHMGFKVVALRMLVSTGMGGVAGLGLALAGGGVWALVGLQLTGAAAGLAVLSLIDRWRPGLRFDAKAARGFIRFALPVMGTHLAKFAGKKLDVAILGFFVPASALGHYYLATRLMLALGLATHYTVSSLGLPVLARLDRGSKAFRAAARRTLWLTSALCLPCALGLVLVADPLVPLVFGPEWRPSVVPLQLLAGFGIFYALGLVAGQILVAAGMPAVFLRLTLVNTALFLLFVAVAAPFGLAAAALAGGIANALMLPAYVASLKGRLGLQRMMVLREQAPVWLAALAMAAVVLGFELVLGERFASWSGIVWTIALGALSYVGALWLVASETLRAILGSLGPGDLGRSAGPSPGEPA